MRTLSVFAEPIRGLPVVPAAVALLIAALTAFLLIASSADAGPAVSTDKTEYHPDETVLISGTGYTSGQLLDIVVIRPDMSIVTGDGTDTPGFDSVNADPFGVFTDYPYILNGIFGLYTVNVYDKADTLHTTLLATTTFLDDAGPAACNGGPTDTSQPGSQYVIDGSSTPPVPTGEIVTSICIKAGANSFGTDQHSGLITVDGTYGNNGCYTVTGIGTSAVTITRVFAGPTCKDISHIDFFTAAPPTTLTVNKVCDPISDPGLFNLLIGATIEAPNAPCGTGTGAVSVSPGTLTVSETAGTGTDLADYTSAISGDCNPSTGQVTLAAGDNKTCTITNTPIKLTPTVTTDIHDASEASVTNVPVDSIVHDEATVSGTGPTPTGTVDFTFYTNVSCSGAGVASGTGIALNGLGVAHPSDPQGPLSAGLYSFKAHYNGDTNYNAADSPCEPLDPVGSPVGGLVEMVIGSDDSGASGGWLGITLVAFLLAGATLAGATAAGSLAVALVTRRP